MKLLTFLFILFLPSCVMVTGKESSLIAVGGKVAMTKDNFIWSGEKSFDRFMKTADGYILAESIRKLIDAGNDLMTVNSNEQSAINNTEKAIAK